MITHIDCNPNDCPILTSGGVYYRLDGTYRMDGSRDDYDIVRLIKKPKTEPAPEHRCLMCKRFVKKGMTYCDRCFDKVAGITAVVAG